MRIQVIHNLKPFHILLIVAVGVAMLAAALAPDTSMAKRGGDDGRSRYYGVIESRPTQGLQGEWVIGGRLITTSPSTEFDQREGPLAIGTCAKVDLRGGRVHELDSEPSTGCQ